MLHREAVSSPDTPEITSSAEHLRSLLWWEISSFSFPDGGCKGGEVITHNVPVSFPYIVWVHVEYLWAVLSQVVFLWETVPAWESCTRGGWAGRIWAKGGSATGPLNITCSIDTTSGLLFSLCNWADNVPWFPLFCTSICSAWAVWCVLASWKWSGVSKRSGYPPPLRFFSCADEPLALPQQWGKSSLSIQFFTHPWCLD